MDETRLRLLEGLMEGQRNTENERHRIGRVQDAAIL